MGQGRSSSVVPDDHAAENNIGASLAVLKNGKNVYVPGNQAAELATEKPPIESLTKKEQKAKDMLKALCDEGNSYPIYMLLALLFSRTMITSLLKDGEDDAYGITKWLRSKRFAGFSTFADNAIVAIKFFIVLVLCVLTGTLQLLPIFLTGWYQPGDIEKGYLARVEKGNDEVCSF